MKVSMLSLLRSAVSTATTMMVIGVFIGNTNTPLVVNAQVLIGCSNEALDDGTPYEFCLVNAPSPFTIDLTSGSSVSFGTESYVFTYCLSGVRSPTTCTCSILVNPSTPAALTDFCDSCFVQELSDTTFLPYFDCSNRLVGDCVGFDSETGLCIDNNGGVGTPAPIGTPIPPTPSPVTPTTAAPRAPTTPSPRAPPIASPVTSPTAPAPVGTIIPPTPFPVVIMTAAPLAPPTPLPVAIATQAPRALPTAFPVTPTTAAPQSPPPTSLPMAAPTIQPTRAPRAVAPPTSVTGQDKGATSSPTTSGVIMSCMTFGVTAASLLLSTGLVMIMG